MRRLLLALPLLLVFSSASSQDFVIPPEKTKQLQQTAMRLAFAEQCNRRFDQPELFKDAGRSLLKFLLEIGMPDAKAKAVAAAKAIADAPQEKNASSFLIFNEKTCGDLAGTLRADLAR